MPYGIPIDLDAVQCVDLGHHWEEQYFGRAETGLLRGTPVRMCVCTTCYSSRLDHLTWDGKVTSRQYFHAEAYITNARSLGEFYERRTNLRAAKGRRLKSEGAIGERQEAEASQRSA